MSAGAEAGAAEQPSVDLAVVDGLLDELTISLVALSEELHLVGTRVEEVREIRVALARELARAGRARDEAAGRRDAKAVKRDRRSDERDAAAESGMPPSERAAREDAAENRVAARRDRIASSEDRAAARRDREGGE